MFKCRWIKNYSIDIPSPRGPRIVTVTSPIRPMQAETLASLCLGLTLQSAETQEMSISGMFPIEKWWKMGDVHHLERKLENVDSVSTVWNAGRFNRLTIEKWWRYNNETSEVEPARFCWCIKMVGLWLNRDIQSNIVRSWRKWPEMTTWNVFVIGYSIPSTGDHFPVFSLFKYGSHVGAQNYHILSHCWLDILVKISHEFPIQSHERLMVQPPCFR